MLVRLKKNPFWFILKMNQSFDGINHFERSFQNLAWDLMDHYNHLVFGGHFVKIPLMLAFFTNGVWLLIIHDGWLVGPALKWMMKSNFSIALHLL